MTPTELRQRRAKAIHDARAVVEKARVESRELSAEEQQAVDRLMAQASDLKQQYERLERLDADLRDLDESQGRRVPPHAPGARGDDDGASERHPYTFSSVRVGRDHRGQRVETQRRITLPHGSPGWQRHQPENREAFGAWLRTGEIQAALRMDSDVQGGYLTVPEEFVAELIKDVDDMVWVRQLARTFTTNAQSLGAPRRSSKFNAFNWGTELSDAEDNADTALKFGKRSLTPHHMTGSILVSRDLIRATIAGLDAETIVREEMARDAGEVEEEAFLAGDGVNKPLGLFTASNDGISTARDVSTGNTATAITTDNLRTVKYTLKLQYRNDPSLRWLFSRTALSKISLLKDGNGQYLWQQGMTLGDPDRILNVPIAESEFAPSTFTTGQYVGLLGVFRYYWIVDALFMDMQRLVETYAKTNQIQYIARRKLDGAPMLDEAFVRVKLG